MKSNTKKILLNETVRHVGKVGDVVEVSAGYARNFLIPKGLAVEPTAGNLKKVEARRAEYERLEKERRAGYVSLLEKIKGVELTLVRRANEQGKLFGSVSATDIANELTTQGYPVEPEHVDLLGRLDHIDKYTIAVRFDDDLETEIKVYVAPDDESKAAMEDAARIRKAAEAEAAKAAKAAAEAKEE
jgi:large subunit ribosomal protein L9